MATDKKNTNSDPSLPIYIIYARKSKFTGKGESIQNQIDCCKNKILQMAALSNTTLSEEQILIFQDEGFSGGNTDRPAFQEMMTLCRSKTQNIKAIVCYKLDRFSRSISDFSAIFNELNDKLGIEFASSQDNFDTTTPTGKAFIMLVTVFAEFERNILAERVRDNKEGLAKTGRWLGGQTPLGYKSVRKSYWHDDGLNRERTLCALETIPEEKELVQRIFHNYLKYQSLTRIQTDLRLSGIKSRNDKYFSSVAIRAILTNPVYMSADKDAWNYFEQHNCPLYSSLESYNGQHGIMAYNKTIEDTTRHSRNYLRGIDEWIVAIGEHEPFVTGKDWVTVQNLLQQNASKSFRTSTSSCGLLSGILVCGNCGAYMRPKAYRGINSDGTRKFGYLCETKDKSRRHECDMKNVPGNELDKLVCDKVKENAIHDLKLFQQQLSSGVGNPTPAAQSIQSKLESSKKQYNQVEKKISNLVTKLSEMEGAATKYIVNQINELDKEKQHLESEIDCQEKLLQQSLSPEIELEKICKRLTDFAYLFDTMTFEEKRRALRSLVNTIVWDGSEAHIYYTGTIPSDSSSYIKKEPLQQGCQ